MSEPRPANDIEIAAWEKFKRYYERVLTPVVKRAKVAAEITAAAQETIDAQGVQGYVWDANARARIESILNRYNLLGRYILAVESARYFIRLSNGDIDILAAESMPADQYQNDFWPSLGIVIPAIIYVIAVGVVLVGGLFGVSAIIEADAKKETEINKGRLIEADREMAKQPEPVRRAWGEMKKQNEPKAREVGILERFFGSESAGKIGGAIAIALLAVGAAFAFSKGRK